MVFQTAGEESSGLDLVLPDSGELLWSVVGIVVLLATAAGVVALVVVVVRGARPPRRPVSHDGQLNELTQRVRALEENAQCQHVE